MSISKISRKKKNTSSNYTGFALVLSLILSMSFLWFLYTLKTTKHSSAQYIQKKNYLQDVVLDYYSKTRNNENHNSLLRESDMSYFLNLCNLINGEPIISCIQGGVTKLDQVNNIYYTLKSPLLKSLENNNYEEACSLILSLEYLLSPGPLNYIYNINPEENSVLVFYKDEDSNLRSLSKMEFFNMKTASLVINDNTLIENIKKTLDQDYKKIIKICFDIYSFLNINKNSLMQNDSPLTIELFSKIILCVCANGPWSYTCKKSETPTLTLTMTTTTTPPTPTITTTTTPTPNPTTTTTPTPTIPMPTYENTTPTPTIPMPTYENTTPTPTIPMPTYENTTPTPTIPMPTYENTTPTPTIPMPTPTYEFPAATPYISNSTPSPYPTITSL
jgi:hypothetical protein